MSIINNCCTTTLFNQSSIIPDPICVPACLPDYSCPLGIINTSCIVYNGISLECLDVPSGSPLNTLILALEDLCTSIVPPTDSCTLKVSETDDCCDYLVNKIVSDTIDITTETDGSGCETLRLEVPVNDCYGKVFASPTDTTCDFLSSADLTTGKIRGGTVVPILQNAGGDEYISLQKQVWTVHCCPQGIVNNIATCATGPKHGGVTTGTVIIGSTAGAGGVWNFSTPDVNTFQANAPSGNVGTGLITLAPGVYDITIYGGLSWTAGIQGTGYIIAGFGLQSPSTNSFGSTLVPSMCYEQAFLPINLGAKGYVVTNSSSGNFYIKVYNALTNAGSGVAYIDHYNPNSGGNDALFLSIEKVA